MAKKWRFLCTVGSARLNLKSISNIAFYQNATLKQTMLIFWNEMFCSSCRTGYIGNITQARVRDNNERYVLTYYGLLWCCLLQHTFFRVVKIITDLKLSLIDWNSRFKSGKYINHWQNMRLTIKGHQLNSLLWKNLDINYVIFQLTDLLWQIEHDLYKDVRHPKHVLTQSKLYISLLIFYRTPKTYLNILKFYINILWEVV